MNLHFPGKKYTIKKFVGSSLAMGNVITKTDCRASLKTNSSVEIIVWSSAEPLPLHKVT